MKTSHSFVKYFLGLIAFFLIGILSAYKTNPKDEWKLILQQDGISFYATNTQSKISNTLNTLIKVVNGNSYQVLVTFTPSFSCKDGEPKVEKSKESTYIEPSDGHSLHSFKICEKGNSPKISLANIIVEKR